MGQKNNKERTQKSNKIKIFLFKIKMQRFFKSKFYLGSYTYILF